MKAIDATQGLTQLEEAQRIVLESTPILGLEKISILDALGRVLGEDIVAERDNPPWDNSAMDGFAVRWDDIKQEHAIQKTVTLTVIEDVAAGKMPSKYVGAKQAIRIMTGAPLPKGADTVLKVEDTEHTPDSVRVFKPEQQGANIRPQGEDVKKGDCIIGKGTRIRPGEAGMLAILAKSFVFAISGPVWRSFRPVTNWRIWMSDSARRKSSIPTAMGLRLRCRRQVAFLYCSGLRGIRLLR